MTSSLTRIPGLDRWLLCRWIARNQCHYCLVVLSRKDMTPRATGAARTTRCTPQPIHPHRPPPLRHPRTGAGGGDRRCGHQGVDRNRPEQQLRCVGAGRSDPGRHPASRQPQPRAIRGPQPPGRGAKGGAARGSRVAGEAEAGATIAATAASTRPTGWRQLQKCRREVVCPVC